MKKTLYKAHRAIISIVAILFINLFFISFTSASTYSDCSIYGNCKPIISTTTSSSVNYSLVNVNNSQYFQGYTPTTLKDWIQDIIHHNSLHDLQGGGGEGTEYYHLGYSVWESVSNFFDGSFVNEDILTLMSGKSINMTGNITASNFFGNFNGTWNGSSSYLLTSQWNATNTSYLTASQWNSTNTSYVPYTGANQNVNLGNNNLTVNGTTLFVDTNNNRVGIGTTAPGAMLDIVGGGYGLQVTNNAGAVNIHFKGTSDTYSYSNIYVDRTDAATNGQVQYWNAFNFRADDYFGQGARGFAFYSYISDGAGGGAYRAPFMLTESGNVILVGAKAGSVMDYGKVGIGTANPFATLHVNGSAIINGTLQIETANQVDYGFKLSYLTNSVQLRGGYGYYDIKPSNPNYGIIMRDTNSTGNYWLNFFVPNSYSTAGANAYAGDALVGGYGNLRFYSNNLPGTPVINLLTSGNVGIGTATPFSTTRLHVNGNILANGTINATTDVCIQGGVCLSGKISSSGGTSNLNLTGYNITANVYHGMIDWINVPISLTLTGSTACSNLNNLVAGYSYTCQTCNDALLGTQINCGTIASVVENCACKVA